MSLTSDSFEYIREINSLETKAYSGEVDKLLINKLPFKIFAKWKPCKTFMMKNQFLPFAKQTFEESIRREIYDAMKPIEILNKRNGGTEDSKKAYKILKQKWDSLPKRKSKKSEKMKYLNIGIAALTFIVMISPGSREWILPVLAFGVILFLPTITGLGATEIFTRLFEKWWYNYCKRQLSIDFLKTKIREKTLEY